MKERVNIDLLTLCTFSYASCVGHRMPSIRAVTENIYMIYLVLLVLYEWCIPFIGIS